MKRFKLLMFVLFAIMAVNAQSPADRLFERYAGKEGYTTVFISKYMFDLFNSVESDKPETQEMQEVISKLTGIKILTSEEPDKSINFLKEIKKEISSDGYKELMIIKEEDQDVRFLAHESEGKISELLLIVSGGGENVLMIIQGDIDMKDISKLTKTLDIDYSVNF
ncbi:MAG: DUF4252 domain-containing protein [Bacteroidales bacterium]|nr:DUF4252 domain-containing protein [Bacteroidales bacterium]